MRARVGVRGGAMAPDRGFVLVGVVMFVLALTILGLSLYAISGYEGQFLTDTQAEEQALFAAEGGIALVQELLSVPPYDLDQAHQAQDYEHVVLATAWQDNAGVPDSTSIMDWSRHVFIRVRTTVGGQSRIVEAEFMPTQRHSPYKRLFTGVSSIQYTQTDGGGHTRRFSGWLNGPVWQTVTASADTAWVGDVFWQTGRPMLTEAAPAPDVSGFMTQHLATAVQADYADSNDTGDDNIVFDAGAGVPLQFWKSPPKTFYSLGAAAAGNYEFYCRHELVLEVRGIAVWLAPAGIRFDNRVTIRKHGGASGTQTLVIVTGPNGTHVESPDDYRDVGLWFFDQGMNVENGVNVILVSSGHVRMEIASQGGGGLNFDMPDLNVYADRITLMGPRPFSGIMRLTHPAAMDAVIEDLTNRGALPAATGTAAGGFAMVPGTWRQP